MELWIRDQSKTGLYKIDNVYIHEDEDKTIHIWTDGINKYLKYYLGGYKSKERALEILDEIQDFLSGREAMEKMNKLGGNMNNVFPTMIYTMPEE